MARLNAAKKIKSPEELVGNREVEKKVNFMDVPHPAAKLNVEYECIEEEGYL